MESPAPERNRDGPLQGKRHPEFKGADVGSRMEREASLRVGRSQRQAYIALIHKASSGKAVVALSDTLKALSERSQAEADFEARKPEILDRWRESVDRLYAQVDDWLAPFLASQVVRLERGNLELNEELLGRYDASTLTISAGSYVVLMHPVARVIIGGLGRVDMFRQGRSSRDERVLLIRISDEERADWLIRIPSRETTGRQVDPLTKERFEAALDDLLR